MSARVSLLTREGCHLCADARVVVDQVCAAKDVAWQEVDIDSHEALRARYSDDVPVVIVDGEVVAFWRIDADRLRSALA